MQIGFGLSLSSARRSVQMVNVLDAISWNRASYPLTFAKNGGVWSCDFDRSDYLPDNAIVTSYWVSTAGNNANNGLSSGAPKRSIHAAITAGNATGQPYRVTVAAGTYYREDGPTGSSGTVVPTQDVIMVASGGRVVCPQGSSLSWPGSKDATYTNTTIVARSNVCGVVDLASPDGNGDAPRLTRVASAALCDSTPGSYAQVGSNLHVNRADGAVASNANTRAFLSAVGCPFLMSTAGKKAYVEGFDFEGGTTAPGGSVTVASTATGAVLMMRDCTARYAGHDATLTPLNGFGINGGGLFVFDGCRAAACTADGFNGHWTVDSSRVTHILTINCTGSTFGTMASSNSNNALTIHDTVVCVDVMGDYDNSRGGCIRNVNDSRMLALGTRSGPDAAGGGITPVAFRVDDTAVIYAVDATAIASSPSDYSALTTGTGKIYLRGYTPGIGIVSGTTAMPSTVYVGPTYTAPANTVAPTISGGTTQGATLTATAGTWTGTPTPSIAGQWRVNGANASGATSSTFSTVGLAVGDVVTYRETATNVVSAVSATSSGVTLTAADAGPTEIPDAIIASGRSAEMIAPEGISFTPDFDAIGTHFGISAPSGDYDPRMHNLFYSWSFDDPGGFVAPENILPEWQDANAAIGFRGRHVFRAPGTYTVRLDVAGYVGGEIVRAYSTLDVTIADPAATFAGAKTYFVSPSSDWTNAPSGSQHITSLDDAAGWANEDGAGPYRIMLNRGETHAFGGRRFGFNVTTGSTIHVVAGPGGGAAPVLTCTGGFSAGANDDATYATKSFVAQGLVLNGPYDPVTPSDPDVTSAFSFWGPYSPQQILVDRCEMRGFGHGIYIGDSVARHIYINDSVIEGYGQWGLIGSHYTGLSMLGCRIQSHEGAPINNGFDMGGTMRVGGQALATVVSSCDFFCRQGWSGLGGGYLAVQPCIRLEAEGTAGAEYSVTRSSFEGGFSMLTISRGDDPSVIVNAVLDSLYFLGGYQTSNIVGVSCGGVTVRNAVAVIPSTVQRLGPGLGAFFAMDVSGGTGVLDAPMQAYGNTIVNYTTETLGVISNPGGYTAVTNQNNLVHQPNASPAQSSNAPLTTTPALWTPREAGYRSTTVALMTDTATPSGAAASYAPASGSAALGAATGGLIPPASIDGADRTAPPNRGAW